MTVDRIDAVWMVISEDETGEGICAAPMLGPDSMIPLIAGDEARLKDILPWARQIASLSGKRLKLIKLTHREEVTDFLANETAH